MDILGESFICECILTFLAFLLYIYYFSIKTFNYWKLIGVPYEHPKPLFGNLEDFFLARKCTALIYQEIYKSFTKEKFVGIFYMRTPMLLVRDPQLLQAILVKDFAHFYNRGRYNDKKLDPINSSLVDLNGTEWKTLRNKLAPTFSSGKLKIIYHEIDLVAQELVNAIHKSIVQDSLIEICELLDKFSTDVRGSCAFGIKVNSFTERNSEFNKMTQEVFKTTYKTFIKHFLRSVHHNLPRILNLKTPSANVEKFFLSIIKDVIDSRKKNKIQKKDYLQHLINIRQQEESNFNKSDETTTLNQSERVITSENLSVELDDMTITANSVMFLSEKTTASSIGFALLELAANTQIQDLLRHEILTIINSNNPLSYESIQNMQYMNKVISETLRKYPATPNFTRICTKPYAIPGSNLLLKKGMKVMVPVYAIHHDATFYPHPEIFDPVRFSDHNVKKRPAGTYLPFGDGPRICIGMRFALLEMKVVLVRLLSQFEFRLSHKTVLPLHFNPKSNPLLPHNGIWLNVYKRQ